MSDRPLILLIEDDKFLQDFYKQTLGDSGYDVEVLGDGSKAVETLERLRPSLIVLDYALPNISGLDFLKMYQGRKDLPRIPVILFSAVQNQAMVTQALRAGATTYLNKHDTTPEVLIATIRNLLHA